MVATSEEFAMHGFDIRTYLCLLPSYLQKIKLYLEKRRPQPKGRKITLVSDNEISEVKVKDPGIKKSEVKYPR